MVITSPAFVANAMAVNGWQRRAVVLFTNEPNTTMFDGLRSEFALFTEDDLIAMLSEEQLMWCVFLER
jgi:hypothetical protein